MYLVQECADTDLDFLVGERNATRRAAVSSGSAQADLLTSLSADDVTWIRLTWQGMVEVCLVVCQRLAGHHGNCLLSHCIAGWQAVAQSASNLLQVVLYRNGVL